MGSEGGGGSGGGTKEHKEREKVNYYTQSEKQTIKYAYNFNCSVYNFLGLTKEISKYTKKHLRFLNYFYLFIYLFLLILYLFYFIFIFFSQS